MTRIHSVSLPRTGRRVGRGDLASAVTRLYNRSHRYSAVVSTSTSTGFLNSGCTQLVVECDAEWLAQIEPVCGVCAA